MKYLIVMMFILLLIVSYYNEYKKIIFTDWQMKCKTLNSQVEQLEMFSFNRQIWKKDLKQLIKEYKKNCLKFDQ